MIQLPIPLKLADNATLENFYSGDNKLVVAYLKQLTAGSGEFCTYLYGAHGVGLTHLLQACCRLLSQQGKTVGYLPLAEAGFSPDIFEGMDKMQWVCLDDLETIVQKPDWEEALFHLYNRLQANQSHLLVAARAAPAQLNWHLPDLASRLSAAVVFQVKPLSEDQKITALQQRAKARGLELSLEVGRYLLTHCPRDMQELYHILMQLDEASLIAQRRLTIPFVKEVLNNA